MFSKFTAQAPKSVDTVLVQFSQACADLDEIQQREKATAADIEYL